MKQFRSRRPSRTVATDAHPIAVAAERTGLSQDVLRVWERRYNAVTPSRASNGQRVYSDADLERLRLLHAATDSGRSISQVAALSTTELRNIVAGDRSSRVERMKGATNLPDVTAIIDTALDLTRSLHGPRLDDHLRRAAVSLGVPDFISRVAVPILKRVGDEWHAGRLSPAQEHLTSSVLYDIFIDRMRAFSRGLDTARILVATPAGERHAIGAALVGAAAAVEGWSVIYLGADLPAEDIATAAIASDVRVVALSVLYIDDRDRILKELRKLRRHLPDAITLFVGGAGARQLESDLTETGIRITGDIREFFEELRSVP